MLYGRRPSRGLVGLVVCLGLLLSVEPLTRITSSGMRSLLGKALHLGFHLGFWEMVTMDEEGFSAEAQEEDDQELEEQHLTMFRAITEHCLPKLVCELFSKEGVGTLTEGEISLMSLIGVTSLSSSSPSKYHFAAHMGQLIRGVEGGGCHEFFPICPFSGDDVRLIARKIQLSR